VILAPASARVAAQTARLRLILIAGIAVGLAPIVGLAAGQLAWAGHGILIVGLVMVALPALAWKRPDVVILILVGGAVAIEQLTLPSSDLTTDQVPLFHSLNALGVQGLYLNPFELALATVAAAALARAAAEGSLAARSTPLLWIVLGLAAVVVAAAAYGLARGGDNTVTTLEVRPWIYLVAMFLAARYLTRDTRHITALLWILMIGTGLKGVQAVVRYLELRDAYPRPGAVLEHEQTFFFGLFIVTTAALWFIGRRSRLRTASTALLPFVVLGLMANNRRAVWLILALGIALLVAVVWARKPELRRRLAAAAVIGGVVSLVYLPVYWTSSSILGEPARAVRSAIDPNVRDQASDLYRQLEDVDLAAAIRSSTPFGDGFGRPIPHPSALVDLTAIDPFINYIPHNQVLYLWIRLGVAGTVLFWTAVAAMMMFGVRLARFGDADIALLGTVCAVGAVGFVVIAYYDQGMASLRIMAMVGFLLGLIDVWRASVQGRTAEAS
jgi:hypothetical protein